MTLRRACSWEAHPTVASVIASMRHCRSVCFRVATMVEGRGAGWKIATTREGFNAPGVGVVVAERLHWRHARVMRRG